MLRNYVMRKNMLIFVLMICAFLCSNCITISVIAISEDDNVVVDQGSVRDNCEWELTAGGTLYVSGSGDLCPVGKTGHISNPLEMMPWREYVPLWNSNPDYNIHRVIISKGVTGIYTYSLAGLVACKKIELPNSVTHIGSRAFGWNPSLEAILIPDSVKSIADDAFMYSTYKLVIYGVSGSYAQEYAEEKGYKFVVADKFPRNEYTLHCDKINVQTGSLYVAHMTSDMSYNLNKYTFKIENTDIATICSSEIIQNEPTVVIEGISEGKTNLKYYFDSKYVGEFEITVSNTSSVKSEFTVGMLKYRINDAGVGIVGFANDYYKENTTVLDIPKSVTIGSTSFGVNEILWGAFRDTILTNVSIPSSVSNIERYAFSGCSSLCDINFPSSLKKIGAFAFENCSGLGDVYINSIENISSEAFYGCSNACIFYESSNYIIDCNNTGPKLAVAYTITDNNAEITAVRSFLDTIDIPDKIRSNTVTSIGAQVFGSSPKTTKIILPNSIINIGEKAFYNAKYLTEVIIPSSVKTIGNSAFGYAGELTEIIIPSSVKTIGDSAFYNCNKLHTVTIDNASIDEIGSSAFSKCSALKTFDLKNSNIKIIGNNAFSNCSALQAFTLENCSITSLGTGVFEYCGELTAFRFSENILNIPSRTFYSCKKLNNITLPKKTKNIGDSAFYGCTSIDLIEVPPSVESIGLSAFADCKNAKIYYPSSANINAYGKYGGALNSTNDNIRYTLIKDGTAVSIDDIEIEKGNTVVAIPDKICGLPVTEIGDNGFTYGPDITKIIIPTSIVSIGNGAFTFKTKRPTEWTNIEVNKDNPNFTSYDGVLYNINKTELIACPMGKELNNLILPATLKKIDDHAFSYCTSNGTLVLPLDVIEIGNEAFYSCEAFVYYPGTATLGSSAFNGSKTKYVLNDNGITLSEISLRNEYTVDFFEVPESINGHKVTAIENFTDSDYIKTIVLPSTIVKIGDRAFRSCELLENINIPDGITEIGKSAFYHCDKLTNVNFPKGLKTISKDAFYYCSSVTDIEVPSSVTYIGENAFQGCRNLKKVTIEEGNEDLIIERYAFRYCNALTEFISPKRVSKFGYSVFYDSKNVIMYGWSNTTSEVYANNSGIPFVAYDYAMLIDSATNIKLIPIKGNINSSYQLKVTPVDISSEPGISSVIGAYYIAVVNNGEEVPLGCRAKIVLPLSNSYNSSDVKIYKKVIGGTFVDVTSVYNSEDKTVYFLTESLSDTYLIATGNTSTSNDIAINEVNFPDVNFRGYISDKSIDKNKDGYLSEDEIRNVTSITLYRNYYNDLTGIEYFTNLEKLDCKSNSMLSLNLSKNKALKTLNCSRCNLSTLDLSNNIELQKIYCDNNPLNTLDLSKNTALEKLNCSNCNLWALNLNNNIKLCELSCADNQITELDLTYNKKLRSLSSSDNNLKKIDLTQNTVLDYVYCMSNKLTSLDLSNNVELKTLYCGGNEYGIKLLSPIEELEFDLTELEEYGFNSTKATNWHGATYNASKNTLSNFRRNAVTYDYDCGNNQIVSFTLKVISNSIVNNQYNITLTQVDGNELLSSSLALKVDKIEPPPNTTIESAVLAYNLSLMNGYTEIEPNCMMKISMPLPNSIAGNTAKVFLKTSDGNYINMNAVYDSTSKTISFNTGTLGEYVIAGSNDGKGDLNDDGKVNNRDLILLRIFLSQTNAEYNPVADINGDGKVNNRDLILLRSQLSQA